MATDLSYEQALERSSAGPAPHAVILGPVPCSRCGAWVEWAGVEWLALGTLEPHSCEPFLLLGRRSGLNGLAIRPRSAGALELEPVQAAMDLPPLPWQAVLGALVVVALVLLASGWRPA